MTEKTGLQVTDSEIVNMRHNLNLLRAQLQVGRIESSFFDKQVARMADLLTRLELEHKQLKRQSRLEALYSVGSLLGSSLDLQTVLDQVMDAIIQLTNAERGFMMLRDDDGQIEIKAARNFDQQTLSSDKFKYSRTITNQVLDAGELVVTTNAAEDPRYSQQDSVIGQALRSIMATPLRVRGSVIGLIYVDNSAVAGLFENEDLAVLDTFAAQAAVAIDNAQLFSVTDQKLAERVGRTAPTPAHRLAVERDARRREGDELHARMGGAAFERRRRLSGADRRQRDPDPQQLRQRHRRHHADPP